MSILGKIIGGIFGDHAGATRAGGAAASASAPAAPAAEHADTAHPPHSINVAPILDRAAAGKEDKLEWRTSIVDLMKALDIDPSLAVRKELAKELGYTGDSNNSASLNVWLHKQVMSQLVAHGGRLPPEIKH